MVLADESSSVFSERLTPTFLAWLIAPGFGGIFFVMFLPIGVIPAAGIGAIVMLLAALGVWSLAARVELTRTELVVGRARIDVASLGEATACDPAQMAHWMGPGSDARSFVLTRPWVRTGVHIEQTHEGDPTPYWLFSLRNHEQFVATLASLKSQ